MRKNKETAIQLKETKRRELSIDTHSEADVCSRYKLMNILKEPCESGTLRVAVSDAFSSHSIHLQGQVIHVHDAEALSNTHRVHKITV